MAVAPACHRLEIGQPADLLLGPGDQLIVRHGKIDGEAKRLGHMPGGLDKELQAVAFGVAKIDRPGGAVGHRFDGEVAIASL